MGVACRRDPFVYDLERFLVRRFYYGHTTTTTTTTTTATPSTPTTTTTTTITTLPFLLLIRFSRCSRYTYISTLRRARSASVSGRRAVSIAFDVYAPRPSGFQSTLTSRRPAEKGERRRVRV
uniref:Uncharacterized protein n=1 Tax=Schizaphis graminum TaxID=13262 RepID=A0A2S2NYI4_SCHGA